MHTKEKKAKKKAKKKKARKKIYRGGGEFEEKFGRNQQQRRTTTMAFVGLASTRSLCRFARVYSTGVGPAPTVVPTIQDTTEVENEAGEVTKERIARTAPIKVI